MLDEQVQHLSWMEMKMRVQCGKNITNLFEPMESRTFLLSDKNSNVDL